MPGGGDPAGISEAKKDYELAASKCPKTIIIGGGYSQGAAITHRAVEQLSATVKGRIAGIVLYGDTQNTQSGGKIKGFPPEKAKVYCNGYGELRTSSSDGVCGGLLNVNGGHLSYGSTFSSAATWLAQKVQDYKRTSKSPGSAVKARALTGPIGSSGGSSKEGWPPRVA
jgi:cutinase